MGRKRKPQDGDPFGDEVAYAYLRSTQDQRIMVAEDWISGRKVLHITYAKLVEINADALLVASLLDAEHPSVCAESGRPRSHSYGELLEMVKHPVDNSPKTVDNLLITVDKSVSKCRKTVEKAVDKKGTYPQEPVQNCGEPDFIHRSVSYPLFIHTPTVDKISV